MNERTGDLTFDLSHEGELRVGARLRTAADLNRFIDSLYHVGFLLWPVEISAIAAGEEPEDRPGMMRAGVDLASNETAKSYEAANAPKKPAGTPGERAPPLPRPMPERLQAATGRGSQAGRAGNPRAGESVVIAGVAYPTKRAAIVALFKRGTPTPVIIAKVGTTPDGYKAAMKAARRLGELSRQ